MLLLVTSFLAGVLTVLAPCILPLLPIIIGGTIGKKGTKSVFVLVGSLGVSIIAFTLLLRASTIFIEVPPEFWTIFAGAIILAMGLVMLYPGLWERVSIRFSNASKHALEEAGQQDGVKREILMGAALGPVFTSCSPTYALILATVLPASFLEGVFYTGVYVLGLSLVLFLIAFLGQRFTKKLRGLADPDGRFKKVIGMLFVLVGVAIIFGWDKQIEAFIIDQGYFGVTALEENLVEQIKNAQ